MHDCGYVRASNGASILQIAHGGMLNAAAL